MNRQAAVSAANNREKIRSLFGRKLIVLQGNSRILKTKDCYYPFRQFSNFLYFTGVDIPDCKLLLTFDKEILFVPKPSKHDAVWLGDVINIKNVKERFNIKHVFYNDKFASKFKELSLEYKICYAEENSKDDIKKIRKNIRVETEPFKKMMSLLRALKSDYELSFMSQASSISRSAFFPLMKRLKPGLCEYHLKNIFEKNIYDQGALHTAYPTIVASGVNSSYLHYEGGNAKLKSGDLCLIDAGAEFNGYASDITRTVPVSKRFTDKQRNIYQIVLAAQKEAIICAKSGINLKEIQSKTVEVIIDGLKSLKILKGSLAKLKSSKAYFLFYPHGVSHMLGLDVHDLMILDKKAKQTNKRGDTVLKEGMVITVEPGVYFNPIVLTSPKIRRKHKYHVNWDLVDNYLGFGGIRIEDNIYIKESDNLNLTNLPKDIKDIESLRL